MGGTSQTGAPAFRLNPLAEADKTGLYYSSIQLGHYRGAPSLSQVQDALERAAADAAEGREEAARGRPPPAQYWVAEASGGSYVAYVGAHRDGPCYRFCVSFRTGLSARARRAIVAAALSRLREVLVGVPCVYAQAINPRTYETYGFTTIDRTTIRRKAPHKNRAPQRPMCVVAYAFESPDERARSGAQCVQHTPARSSHSANSTDAQCVSTLSSPT